MATSKNRTNPGCPRCGGECLRVLVVRKLVFLVVSVSSRGCTRSLTQIYYRQQHTGQQLDPALQPSALLTSAPPAFLGAQANLLGPRLPLSSLALQFAHALSPPLHSWHRSFKEDVAKAETFFLRFTFIILKLSVCTRASDCVCECKYLQRPEEGISIPGARVRGG